MTSEDRRRLGALSGLVLGVFLGLCLVPGVPTGAIGRTLGAWLWRVLGAGAVGLPVLGLGLALAGFDRLPRLDMKRAAILLSGLSLLAPFVIGVLTSASPAHFDPPPAEWTVAARATGLVPGLLAYGAVGLVGKTGGLLLGFLSLSTLTILTLAWHPLRRLEKGGRGERSVARSDRAAPPPPPPPLSLSPREVGAAAPQDSAVGNGGRLAVETGPGPRPAEVTPRRRTPREPKLGPGSAGAASDTPDDELPPIDLLRLPPPQDTLADEAKLDRLGHSLMDTLRTFKVDGYLTGRTSGPVVTQFEVAPAPGVKAGRIVALADDLAITMRATSIRVAPIPGKGAVGVEIPNPTPKLVSLRELLESPEWDRSRAVLPVALGRDLEGKPVVTDLAKMPHLLIAGATGTGKSVGINGIVSCLVYRYPARLLRLLMIDPKMVELSMYNELPHLRHKVVTNNNDAARVLKWAVYEMNRRYELFHANGARNIGDFNRKVDEGKPLRFPVRERPTLKEIAGQAETTPPEPPTPEQYGEGVLPFIVIVVDELADLMMTVAADVETPLAMLAQKARATGIHLILATQRPSVNVLTGLIKANFPSRIAYRVASKVDSRTILDQNGAEALIGNGDMLFLPPGRSEPMRLQGAFIGTEETEGLMEWYKARRQAREAARAAAASELDILAFMRAQEIEEDRDAEDLFEGERDPLFREAAEACIQNQGGSTSLLQRKLRIGYGRAARVIDQLHGTGILGPPDGSKPREVLIGIDQLDDYCG